MRRRRPPPPIVTDDRLPVNAFRSETPNGAATSLNRFSPRFLAVTPTSLPSAGPSERQRSCRRISNSRHAPLQQSHTHTHSHIIIILLLLLLYLYLFRVYLCRRCCRSPQSVQEMLYLGTWYLDVVTCYLLFYTYKLL